VAPEAGRIIAGIESASLAVVNLAFQSKDVGHPMKGFGFLVPHNEPHFPLMGVLWSDSAFPHHGKPGHRLVRVFIGGTRTPDVMSRSHEELVATARKSLRELLDIRGEPVLIDVCPYPSAIPQYYLGHLDRMERLRSAVEAVPGLHLVGNYLEGVSINDCVRLGKRVAGEIVSRNGAGVLS
jgi:oxygen-dependent protoporphyrinogen oxidase